MNPRQVLISRILPTFLTIGFSASLLANPVIVDSETRNMLRLVQDPDGHSNIRSAANLSAPVIGKIMSGGPVFVLMEPKSGFHQVFIDYAKDKRDSFIHTSRLQPITKWKAFGPGAHPGAVKQDGFEAVVKAAPFVVSEHQISRDAQGMVKVNGKSPWGQDGGMPRHILLLEVFLNGKKIDLPQEATDNLYEPSLTSLVLLTPDDPSRKAILMMVNSDGAGGYYVAWGFEDGVYRGRSVMSP
jgi:hypothetical protein